MRAATEAERLHEAFAAVVRSLGLLRPDTTPCGQAIGITQAHALAELARSGAVTQRHLGDVLRLEKSTVSRLVDQMEEARLVVRVVNPADRRSVLVELSENGRQRAKRLGAAQRSLFASLLERLAPEDRNAVVEGLSRLEEAARATVA